MEYASMTTQRDMTVEELDELAPRLFLRDAYTNDPRLAAILRLARKAIVAGETWCYARLLANATR